LKLRFLESEHFFVRHRTLLTCYSLETFVSVIPFPLPIQQAAWESVCLHANSTIEQEVGAFVNDSPENHRHEIQQRARRRGIFNCEADLPLVDQMAPGCCRSRFERYLAASKEQCLSSSSSLFVDLSQGGDATHTVIESGRMPALTKSSVIMSLSAVGSSGEKGHFMTARELDFSQGWPCYNTTVAQKYLSCLQHDPDDYYTKMSPHGQVFLRGNGQHLMTMGMWMNWSLSNLILLSDIQCFDPVLMCYHVEDDNPFATKPFQPHFCDDSDDELVSTQATTVKSEAPPKRQWTLRLEEPTVD
jgi:hypothetical protein